ncbi:MAG: MotA/TolQ/ExbB proton channel family protein [Pirellulaceae bacterium]
MHRLWQLKRSRLLFAIIALVFVQYLILPAGWGPSLAQAFQDQAADAAKGNDVSILGWLTNALGPLYIIVFFGLSFILVALCVMNILAARRDTVCPQGLVEGFEALLDEKKYQDAYELAKADESFLGNVLSSGLARLSSGYDHSVEAMQEVGQEESMKLQHRLSYLGLIGTISPMVGLFGTVHGMISSFFAIAAAGGGSPDATQLADGISKALVTTLIGLAIAIPAILAYNILRNRYELLELEVGITSGNLMGRFEKVPSKKD